MQILHKFSVYLSDTLISCYPDQYRPYLVYPVLAIDQNDDGEDLVLIVNAKGQFRWVALDECTLAIVGD